jgi:hypothetical protein
MSSNLPAFSSSFHETFYYGVENVIPIALNGTSVDDIEIKMSYGAAYKRTDSTFVYAVGSDLTEVKIKLYYKKLLISTKNVQILKIPDSNAKVTLDGEKNGTITLSNLSKSKGLVMDYHPTYPSHLKSTISGFHLSFLILDTKDKTNTTDISPATVIKNNSAQFSTETTQKLGKLKKGDILVFSNIFGSTSMRQYSNLGGLQIKITE